MDEESKVPKLIEFLFGETARAGLSAASERLLRWSRAFEDWLAEIGRLRRPVYSKAAERSWWRLLRRCPKMPWELEPADLLSHLAWMEAQGFAPGTVRFDLGYLSGFFSWCAAQGVDPGCPPLFNPAAGMHIPLGLAFSRTKLLTRTELQSLLDFLRRDGTPLGRRAYAFILARLQLGIPDNSIQRLQWGQLEQGRQGVWLRTASPPDRRIRLPDEVWEAVLGWLRASGRLEGMQPESFVFAPLAGPLASLHPDRPEAWVAGRPLSKRQFLVCLKLYGQRLGIASDRLTFSALRLTAARLRLEAGDSLDQMRAFLDGHDSPSKTKYRLGRLLQLPQDPSPGGELDSRLAGLPDHETRPFRDGEGIKHGLYAGRMPDEELQAMLAEDVQGTAEEIAGLREVGRALFHRQSEARSRPLIARLADAYTLAAVRLAVMIGAVKKPARGETRKAVVMELLERFDLTPEQVLSEAALPGSEGQAGPAGVKEEIAATRCVLRRALAVVRAAAQGDQPDDLIHFADIYGEGCNRLLRLLRTEGQGEDLLVAAVEALIKVAYKEVYAEFHLDER